MQAQPDKHYSTLQEALVDYQARHIQEQANKTGFWRQHKVAYNEAGYYEVRNLGIIERILTLVNLGPASERTLINIAHYRNEEHIPETVYKVMTASRSLTKITSPVQPNNIAARQNDHKPTAQENVPKEIAPAVAPQEQTYEAKVDAFINKLFEYGWDGWPGADKVKKEIIDEGKLSISYSNGKFRTLPAEIGDLIHLKQLDIWCDLETMPDTVRNLTNLEKLAFHNYHKYTNLKTLPKVVGEITNLKTLIVGPIEHLPPEIGKLENLQTLSINSSYLKELPNELSNLKNLVEFKISNFEGNELPSVIWTFKNLESLHIDSTHIDTFSSDIKKLEQLQSLVIFNNGKLKSIPEEIGELRKVKMLRVIFNNALEDIPSKIYTITSLEELDLAHNRLENVPAEVGSLVNLLRLDLSGNESIAWLPREIENLENLQLLELENSVYEDFGDGETKVGQHELRAFFGNRVVFEEEEDEENVQEVMPANTSLKQVYDLLDSQPIRINRRQFVEAKLPEIPGEPIRDGDEFLEEFLKVISQLNFDDQTAPGYLSYELLAGDFTDHAKSGDNWDLIRQKVLPRLTGYFKQLYDLPLDETETAGWQMYDDVKPMLKKALSYILNQLVSLNDPEQRATLFTQFVDGMLHCPTGQKEGIDTVLLALLEKKTERSTNLPDIAGEVIAKKKNTFFKTAILSKAFQNTQNVHLISSYQEKLQAELGLSNILGFVERIGIMGSDPFNENSNNVLQVYYTLVTPQRLVDWVLDKTPSVSDLALRQDLDELLSRRATLEPKPPNPILAKKLESLKAQLQNPEVENKLLIESQIKQLEAILNAQKAHSPQTSPEELSKLNAKISHIKSQLRTIEQFKPLSMQVILEYLKDNNFVDTQNPNWWQEYFTADPMLQQTATLTRPGALLLLTHLGFVVSD